MTDEEIKAYEQAIQEYGDGNHAIALWGFLGSSGALSSDYPESKRQAIAERIIERAFDYCEERCLAQR